MRSNDCWTFSCCIFVFSVCNCCQGVLDRCRDKKRWKLEEKKSERSLKEKAGLDFPVFLIGTGTDKIVGSEEGSPYVFCLVCSYS